jgi:hypothetical protein
MFKSGYQYEGLENHLREDDGPGINMRSDYHGKTIKMERFRGSLEEYAQHLSFLKTSLGFIERDCEWKRVPRMILALDTQQKDFNANRLDWSIYSVDILEISTPWQRDKCGSPKEFFRTYKL